MTSANLETPPNPRRLLLGLLPVLGLVLLGFTPQEQALIDEHVWGGVPDCEALHARNGYVRCYDVEHRVAEWVAYHVNSEYLDGPPRKGKFSSFRKDPDTENGVVAGHYTNSGYARGHLAPYSVMGGDRDDDGKSAEEDDFDELTVKQANYMSNMAPQHQDGFNGVTGVWFKLERFIQDTLVEKGGEELWIFAGSIFGPGEIERIGPDGDIGVPPLFYKIVVRSNGDDEAPDVLAFLFPHHRVGRGNIEAFLVSVDILESLTGLDFFSELDDAVEADLEATDTLDNWTLFKAAESQVTSAD